MTNIVKHRFSTLAPKPEEMGVGELVLQLFKDVAILYTKSLNGEVIELGKGITNFSELEDVDLTNVKEGSFLIKQGDKFVASNFIGNIGNLSDLEISNPQGGDYIRYDPLFLSFRNFRPSYNLYELLDVDIPDATNQSASSSMNEKVLYYEHSSGKFKLRERRRFLNDLDDVSIGAENHHQLIQLDTDGVWKNMDLQIVRDTSPSLGGNLNASGFSIINSGYKINTVVCNLPMININYADGDYWILEGVPREVNEQCIVNINVSTSHTNTVFIMMLEVRQDSGNILIGGLPNMQYEDGKPVLLSGNGKTDLITITVRKVNTEYISYVTATALNLAPLGLGGSPAYRYDKNRYPDVQIFDVPKLYDDYFEYVKLLLNFEQEESTGRLWYEDKSDLHSLVTTTATQKAIDLYTFGLQEYVAEFITVLNQITINPTEPITLSSNFTFECFLNHPFDIEYMDTGMSHILFSNSSNTFSIKYIGNIDTNQNTYIQLVILDKEFRFYNAYNYFLNKNNKYVHIAVVRSQESNDVRLFIDGIRQIGTLHTEGTSPLMDDITLTGANIIGFKGLLNTVRITNYVRYTDNFLIPDMRFGLVGGANDILEAQVFDTYMYLDKELEYNLFC